MGTMSFVKLMAAVEAAGVSCTAGADVLVAAAVFAGACVCGAAVAGTTFSVACKAGVWVALLAHADNKPTMKSKRTNFTFFENIFEFLLKLCRMLPPGNARECVITKLTP
jgi:hypothetical protein